MSCPAICAAALDAFLRFDPYRIILCGSHAAGTADEESDVDLIVVYDALPQRPPRRYSV